MVDAYPYFLPTLVQNFTPPHSTIDERPLVNNWRPALVRISGEMCATQLHPPGQRSLSGIISWLLRLKEPRNNSPRENLNG